MKNLTLYNTESIDELVWPDENISISKNTPALSILTDFHHNLPRVIGTNVKAIDVEAMMKRAHVRMKLVVDDNNKFVGLIGLQDLSEENVLKKVNKNTHRDELLVSDFMHPRESLKCFDYEELTNASVSDVLETQRNNHQQHCLVIDRERHQIRGLISARDVARLINRSFDIEKHLSFEALFKELEI
ncbi:CBS domain-containing protein [Glaciecola sp. 33A]|jgi:CBS domain containing-hemolysin-like protein|uniref:CBS domain-containing protein n=1 Tax=Glaciecola sp. 33A TaxID=2057807 RepID=UPI000C34F567|nr:CBS domain-containing protein [Glaciecola sp. 33A]PKI02005.1 histidine kinase [Glaciecola sp. 33A]